MYKALIIGCGNIGAGYDLYSDEVLTHAKAFSLIEDIELTFADNNEVLLNEISTFYNAKVVNDVNAQNIKEFDIVSICTPTPSHSKFLDLSLSANIPLILCEKPVTHNLNDIERWRLMKYDSKVLVNYIRRFQPSYELFKNNFRRIVDQESRLIVNVKYNRGLLNNGGHAIDLLNFLFDDNDFHPGAMNVSISENDVFDYDPTVSGYFQFNKKVGVQLMGMPYSNYSIFEIEFYTENWMISITNGGDEARFYQTINGELVLCEQYSQNGMLKNYMIPVIQKGIEQLKENKASNFKCACDINEYILNEIIKL